MALKASMLRREIERREAELEALREKDEAFQTRESELESAIAEVETDEQRDAMTAEIETFETERSAHTEAVTALENQIQELRGQLEAEEARTPPAQQRTAAPETAEKEERSITTMNTINIRSLPKTQRAFEALPMEQRESIVRQADVQSFLKELRSMKGQTRGIEGGALTIPVVMLDIIAENMYRYSKLLNRVRVRNVNGEARQTVAGLVPEAVWTEMCGVINELTFVFNQVTLDGYKVAGFIPVCNSLLEDNDVNLASMIVEMLSEAVGLAMDKAILYGKGSAYHMPLGIVTRLAQSSKPESYQANAPEWVDLHTTNVLSINNSLTGTAFWAALQEDVAAAYNRYARGEMFWAMNSKTYAKLKAKAIATDINGAFVAMVGGTLPIVSGDIDILEFMPDNDIVGGFGDLYLLGLRAGMTIESSREVQFIQDNTVFKGKMRADGVPVIAEAFVAINIAGSSVTTSLVFAGDDANTVGGILMPATATVASGATTVLPTTLMPFGVKADISWASGTTAKATVSSTGVITGVATGTSTITATAGGKTASCVVTVTSE
ncbi:MAG: phage major capsid protein [Oscillospiraceae bacterium]|nr:phage major capsid protein [Oscillospiraceae bacterium]